MKLLRKHLKVNSHRPRHSTVMFFRSYLQTTVRRTMDAVGTVLSWLVAAEVALAEEVSLAVAAAAHLPDAAAAAGVH